MAFTSQHFTTVSCRSAATALQVSMFAAAEVVWPPYYVFHTWSSGKCFGWAM